MAALKLLSSTGLRSLQLPKPSTFNCGRAYSYITPFIRLPWKIPIMQYCAQAVPEDDAAMPLATKKCVPCNFKDLRPMNEESAKVLSQKVPGWDLVNEDGQLKLKRSWKVKNFAKGMDFFKNVADVAEAEGHHPNLHLENWNNVRVEIWTHAIGGLTENDFILAAKISDLNLQGLIRKSVAGVSSSICP